jgi:hypothetical protein
MTFLSLCNWQKSLQRQGKVARRSQCRHAPRSIRLRLEALEDRIMPTVFTPTTFSDGLTPGGVINTLRDAIIAGNSDTGTATDTVQLSAGTYTLSLTNIANNHEANSSSGDLNINNAAHALVIQGATDANGNPTTIIDQTVADRVFQILNLSNGTAAGPEVTFKNLIIEGGNAQDDGGQGTVDGKSDALGGGILNGGGDTNLGTFEGGSVTLSNVVVKDNQASAGNTWSAFGGGVYSVDGSLTINHSVIQSNAALDGGGDNTAGGGVAFLLSNLSTPQLTITSSTVADNVAQGSGGVDGGGDGGGVYSAGNTTTINASTFSTNSASNSGGGAALFGSVRLLNSTIANNSAADQGGGIYFEPTKGAPITIQLTNDTVSGNQGGVSGGLDDNNGTPQQVTLVNTIVAGNSITNNTGVPSQDVTPAGHIISGGHNLIGINNGFQSLDGEGNLFTNPTDLLGTATNPLNPKLGQLQNNGGPTQVMLPGAGSPLLGAGDPALAPSTDQRGITRPAGGPIDIGAVQVSVAPSQPPATAPQPAPAPPALQVPPLLAFLDQILGGVEKVNSNGTETITDSVFGFPLIVATFNSSGGLVSVTLFGINITFLFG